ncbi:uncharacterized protein LOC117963139 isoform X1 [Acipenser ruthenus]|uniref:uncharacterized protein LOC117963139 isoform X1 n=1 Tax=Acipenser ruthenus TaxID=7906 RepID=UPI00145AA894|nr:uncharacterized protein LOC117963139 isoform X1 [Acipenser ruthenus]
MACTDCLRPTLQRMLLKFHVCIPIAAGSLLVGVPYSISLLAQWLYGWPNKPGFRKYTEALKPRRIYCLTVAVLEMVKYLQYGKLYIQWKSWYRNSANSKYCVKDIHFGRHGNKLDLYYCPHVDGPGSALSPAVIFVYGGAWGSGERSTYCLLAMQMAKELNKPVICPDYSIYPKGNVMEMVQDIADCILWSRETGHTFNIDKRNIVLIGHSAGAHLCALTALFLAAESEEMGIELSKQRDILTSVKGVVGLSGVYHIMNHYQYETWRGVEYVSTMHKAMGGIENFEHYSPTLFVKTLTEDKLAKLPPFTLIHGTKDTIVPVESTLQFSEALTAAAVKASLFILPHVGHTELVTDLMGSNRRYYHTILGCIKQGINKVTAHG